MDEHVFEHDGATYTVRADTLRVAVAADHRFSCDAAMAMAAEILRLAARVRELEAELRRSAARIQQLQDALHHELTKGAEELRRMKVEGDEADRNLVAQIGAAVGLSAPAAVLDPVFGGEPFATTMGGELFLAALGLRDKATREERARACAALLEGVDALGVLGEPGLIDAGDVRDLINHVLSERGDPMADLTTMREREGLTPTELAWCDYTDTLSRDRRSLHDRFWTISLEAFRGGAALGRREERARIRRELLQAFGELEEQFGDYWAVRADEIRLTLDRICPEEG